MYSLSNYKQYCQPIYSSGSQTFLIATRLQKFTELVMHQS